MIVTSYDYYTRFGYNKIEVTYQSYNDSRRLGAINEEQNYKAFFYVYRPLNYNPNGK